jgi:hypothetical protein
LSLYREDVGCGQLDCAVDPFLSRRRHSLRPGIDQAGGAGRYTERRQRQYRSHQRLSRRGAASGCSHPDSRCS